jgi:hypothetical protein
MDFWIICRLYLVAFIVTFQISAFSQAPFDIELVKIKKKNGIVDTLGTIPIGGYLTANVDQCLVKFVKNNDFEHNKNLYFTLLDLQPDGIINVLFPTRNESPQDYITTPMSQDLVIPKRINFGPPFGKESFILIFSEVPIGFNNTSNLWIDNRRENSNYARTANILSPTDLEWILLGEPPDYLEGKIFISRFNFEIRPEEIFDAPMRGNPDDGVDDVEESDMPDAENDDHVERINYEPSLNRYSIPNDLIYTYYPEMFFMSPPEPAYNLRGAVIESIETETQVYVIKGQLRCSIPIESVRIIVESDSKINKTDTFITTSFKEVYRSKLFEKQINLYKGTNIVTVSAYTEKGYSSRQEFRLESQPQKESKEGKDYLLVMAINNYKSWTKLNNPINDATAIKDVLQTKYGFQAENIYTLYDLDCTSSAVDSTFTKLIETLEKNDRLIVFFAGHGYYKKIYNEGYWIPVDGKLNEPSTYISNSTIKKYMQYLPTHHTLFISDACFSGSYYVSESRGAKLDRHLEMVSIPRSRWIFTSGRMEEVADTYEDTNHSPFAWYILNYLKNPGVEAFTISDMANTVTKSVVYNADQTPIAKPLQNSGDEGGEFVFIVK